MSRPFTEVILLDQVTVAPGGERVALIQDSDYAGCIKLNSDKIHTVWSGSKEDFIKAFDLPNDTPLQSGNAGQIAFNDKTTMNFKINYQIWYSTPGDYVPGSNITIDLTVPSYIVFQSDGDVVYVGTRTNTYNSNIFPLNQQLNSFLNSNKLANNPDAATYGIPGTWTPFLLFRYGINGKDIEICIITRSNGQVVINQKSFLVPYFSMTFTGFNKIKRLK